MQIWFGTLGSLTDEQLEQFLSVEKKVIDKAPELGSRAFHRIFATNNNLIAQKIDCRSRRQLFFSD